MYTVGCPFCASPVFSEFWEEIDEHILRCYDHLSPKDKGKPWYADIPDGPSLCKEEAEILNVKMGLL